MSAGWETGDWMYDFINAYGWTIGGGTNEIMRNIIGERIARPAPGTGGRLMARCPTTSAASCASARRLLLDRSSSLQVRALLDDASRVRPGAVGVDGRARLAGDRVAEACGGLGACSPTSPSCSTSSAARFAPGPCSPAPVSNT